MRIIVACGGTGGHVFPGLVMARTLRERGHEVTVWLSGRAIEEAALSIWDGTVWRSGAQAIRLQTLPALLGSLWRCWREMRRWHPDCLLAMGSYASVPPALAANFCRVPLVLHEANAVPGKAVEHLSRRAAVTACSFPTTAALLPGRRATYTGLPVRRELAQVPRTAAKGTDLTIFVTGGSQGAHAVNELCAAAFSELSKELPNLRVIHQSGTADAVSLQERYGAAGIRAEVTPFIRDMGAAYAQAEVVVCRAGAVTCAELCLCGVPAILIPLPSAVRDHQRLNAVALLETGGAILVNQQGISASGLCALLRELLGDAARRQAMSTALLKLATPHADATLAAVVEMSSKGNNKQS